MIAFFAPLALAKSTAIANESLSPLIITCWELLIFEGYAPASRQTSSTTSISMPIIATMPPGFLSQAICINLPLSETSLIVSETESAFEAESEVYSPKL